MFDFFYVRRLRIVTGDALLNRLAVARFCPSCLALALDQVDGEMSELLQNCSQNLNALTEEIQEKEASTEGARNYCVHNLPSLEGAASRIPIPLLESTTFTIRKST